MDARDWFDHLLRRPDFEEHALQLRDDIPGLENYLADFFHAASLPKPVWEYMVAGLRDTVRSHDPAAKGVLYQECVWSLQRSFESSVRGGDAPREWADFPRLPLDFEADAFALRSSRELRPYLVSAFADILRPLPDEAHQPILDGVEAAVSGYQGSTPRGLLAACLAALADRLPADVAVERTARHRVLANESKPLTVD